MPLLHVDNREWCAGDFLSIKATDSECDSQSCSFFSRLISLDGSGGYGGARCSAYGLGGGTEWTHSVSIGMVNAGVGSRDQEVAPTNRTA